MNNLFQISFDTDSPGRQNCEKYQHALPELLVYSPPQESRTFFVWFSSRIDVSLVTSKIGRVLQTSLQN